MRNELLTTLSAGDLDLLRPAVTVVELIPGRVLHGCGAPLSHVYFPEDGLVSMMSGAPGQRVEAALVGREGMVGTAALLGQSTSAHTALVQAPGTALRAGIDEFRQALDASPSLAGTLLAYVHARLVQAGETIYATGKCTVDQRLSRWLLMAHDRLGRDDIDLTHECLANTLGVRRPGVTVALHVLEGKRAIRSKRGRITILDRERLKRLAGAAYRDATRPAAFAKAA